MNGLVLSHFRKAFSLADDSSSGQYDPAREYAVELKYEITATRPGWCAAQRSDLLSQLTAGMAEAYMLRGAALANPDHHVRMTVPGQPARDARQPLSERKPLVVLVDVNAQEVRSAEHAGT